MSTVQPLYAATSAIACTMTSLAASSARGSAAVYNSSTRYAEAVLRVAVQTNGSAPTDLKSCPVYLYTSFDGSSWTGSNGENVSTDKAVTLDSPTNLIYAGAIKCPSASGIYHAEFPVAAILGYMPLAWGYVISNRTGNALNTTAANFDSAFGGINPTF